MKITKSNHRHIYQSVFIEFIRKNKEADTTAIIRIRPAAVLLLAILLSSTATAADYYVDQGATQADDTNPGTESLPWRTLQRAVEQDLAPGGIRYMSNPASIARLRPETDTHQGF